MIQIFDFTQFNELIVKNYGDKMGSKRVNVELYKDFFLFYLKVPDDFEYVFVIEQKRLSQAARMNIFNGRERNSILISDTDTKERLIANAKLATPS